MTRFAVILIRAVQSSIKPELGAPTLSRYGFDTIIDLHKLSSEDGDEQDEGILDRLGYSIWSWVSYGAVGFDESIGSYFVNDGSRWMVGISDKEIETIGQLQIVISAIFYGALIPFNSEGLLSIAVNAEADPCVLSSETASSKSHNINPEYIAYHLEQAELCLRNNS